MVSADAGDGETAIAMSECLDSGLWVRVNLSRTPGVVVVNPPLGTLSVLLRQRTYTAASQVRKWCVSAVSWIFKNRVAFNLGDHLAGAPNRFPGNGDGNT